jgi:hypothetical protein
MKWRWFVYAINGCRGSNVSDNPYAYLFVSSGCEYYTTARFAMHAQHSLVCGNLFHHAVEMLLKGGLAYRGKSLTELTSMGHSLKKLWRAYENDHPEAELERHNKTINRLDKHEDIRYPNPNVHSMGLSLGWSGEPAEVKTSGRRKTPKQYAIVVSDIDDLVADVLKTSSWNPGVFMGTNPAALEAIKRQNNHAKFLTTVMNARL